MIDTLINMHETGGLCLTYLLCFFIFSVGSLGEKGADDRVKHVHVQGCTFTKTQNAARIKTWMVMPSPISTIPYVECAVQYFEVVFMIIVSLFCSQGRSWLR